MMTGLIRFEGEDCPICGNFSPTALDQHPYCGVHCKVFAESGMLGLLEYARSRLNFALSCGVAYSDVARAIEMAAKHIATEGGRK